MSSVVLTARSVRRGECQERQSHEAEDHKAEDGHERFRTFGREGDAEKANAGDFRKVLFSETDVPDHCCLPVGYNSWLQQIDNLIRAKYVKCLALSTARSYTSPTKSGALCAGFDDLFHNDYVTMATNTSLSLSPLGDRVLVAPLEEKAEKVLDSGIIIPDSEKKEKPQKGKVLAVGPGRYDDGVLVPMSVKKGDIILFSKYGYDEVKEDGKEYLILPESQILAVINK